MPGSLKHAQQVRPGAGMIEAGRALEDPRRLVGKYPYQWLFPGPNSRHVFAQGSILVPGAGPASVIFNYSVQDGMRFSLRGLVFAFNGTGWSEGTATGLSFTLQVLAAGTRNVEGFANVLTELGSLQQPYPILGRLEFAPNDQLQVLIANGGGVATGPAQTVTAHLVGHQYPNSETFG